MASLSIATIPTRSEESLSGRTWRPRRSAETGSQALLLAGVAGVTGVTGIVILLAFVVGLLISNTLVAVVSASGFIGAQRMRTLYVIVGAFAGAASLLIGLIFIGGLGTVLPDLQQLLFGAPRP